jgi:serine/threonine-protein kinase
VDVWAAAASYYFMLTCAFTKDFIRGKDAIATALNSPAVPIRKRNSSIPKNLAELIDYALIEKPKIGIQTAAEFKKKLEGAL